MRANCLGYLAVVVLPFWEHGSLPSGPKLLGKLMILSTAVQISRSQCCWGAFTSRQSWGFLLFVVRWARIYFDGVTQCFVCDSQKNLYRIEELHGPKERRVLLAKTTKTMSASQWALHLGTSSLEAGEVSQLLRVLTALAEDTVPEPSTCLEFTIACNPVPEDAVASSVLPSSCMHMIHINPGSHNNK